MNLPQFSVSWVDFVTALILLVGVIRGRKRGLSEELLDTLQWLTIVVVGGLFYQQVCAFINQKPVLSQLAYCIISYVMIALVAKLIFSMIKRHVGQKLMDSDIFGRGEFYLGMMAGMTRFACMYFFALSLLHAPEYSADYRSQKAKQDSYNYGDITFPSVMSVQDEVFKVSFTGRYTEKYLKLALLQPASSDAKALRNENSMAKRRERDVDAIMRGK